jgi:Flp pilus assembly protein TadD
MRNLLVVQIPKTLRRLGLIAAALAAIGGLGLLGYEFYLAAYQRRVLANARAALAKGPNASAAFWVADALKGNPNGVEENRLMADLADAAKSPSVLQWRMRVVHLDPANLRNYLALANSEFELGEPKMALEALRQAPAAAKENVVWQNMSAAAAAGCGLLTEAETHFEEAARLKPDEPLLQVNLRTFRLSLPGKSDEAREWLRQRIRDPVAGLQVQRALLEDALQRNLIGDGEIAKAAIEQNPLSAIGDRVDCLELDFRTNSYAESLHRLQQWVQERPDAAPPLVYWMMRHSLGREAIAWIESAFPEKSRSIALQIAEADTISSLADWPLLTKTIAETDWRGLDYVRQAMLIRAQKETGKSDWNMAWQAFSAKLPADDQSVFMIARLIQGWGWSSEASDLYWRLVNRSARQKTEALGLLLQIYRVGNDAFGLFRVTEAQLRIAPDNIGFRNNFAYLALLLGIETEKALSIATENAKKAPNEPKVLATYSFACVRQGKSEEARKILEALPSETLAQPDISLYYAAALLADHDPTAALKFAKIAVTSKEMLPQEESIAKGILLAADPAR